MANAYRSVLKDAVNPTGNALPADVLAGKTFSNVDGIDKTGTMVNNGAVTITLTAQDPSYTVPEGYHNGSGTVSFTPSGGGGADLVVTCSSDFAGETISCTDGTTTFTEICPSTSPYAVIFESISTGTWTISGTAYGQTFSSTVTILDFTAELNSIPEGSTVTPTDDIQTWLHCANIWDKTYTTISQVLADTTTLLALISSNNAVDYMSRSSTWASDVCSDSTSMTYIGTNNYCANKLLADSTWGNAICNSSYFETVLNTKIPTLTASTSQVLYTASTSDNYPYYAFDNRGSTAYAENQNQTTLPFKIGYQFSENVSVHKIVYIPQKSSESASLLSHVDKFYFSDDGTQWTEFAAKEVTSSDAKSANVIIVNMSTKHRYYAYLAQSATESNGWFTMAELQFYGRSDV